MIPEQKSIPVLLLTGYLGSGKTTLLNRILNNRRGIRFAVIVNDIGEVNIDADLIAKDGIVGQKDDSLVALQNGCICCTLKMDLVKQVSELLNADKFDYIVIEASGICEPEPIAQTIVSIPYLGHEVNRHGSCHLDCIVTVVDALRLKEEFDNGENIATHNYSEENIENLIAQQIEFCNIVLLNKISLVSREDANKLRSMVKALQPKAEIFECDFADIDFDKILNTHLFEFNKVATAATWIKEIEKSPEEIEADHDDEDHHHEHEHHHHEHEHHEHEHEHGHEHEHEHGHGHHHHHHHGEGEAEEYGIGTFVYYRRRPLSLNKFDRFVAKKWPRNIIRSKGVCYFSENPDMSYLFEQAGSQKQLTEAGQWYATAPAEELQDLMVREPGLMRDWDEQYGDRMQKIVFIGQNLDKHAITEMLDDCLD